MRKFSMWIFACNNPPRQVTKTQCFKSGKYKKYDNFKNLDFTDHIDLKNEKTCSCCWKLFCRNNNLLNPRNNLQKLKRF